MKLSINKFDRIMKRPLLILLFLTVIGETDPAYAAWIGKGEVVGQVTSSRFFGGGVQFDFAFDSQTSLDLSLATPCTFVYYGPRHEAVSVGDRLHLHVNKGGVPRGIHVESIEFLADQPGSPLGTPPRPSYTGLLVLLGLVCGFAMIVYVAVRSKKNRKDVRHADKRPCFDTPVAGHLFRP